MKRSPLFVAGVAAAAALGLALVPAGATAHTDNLFTWAFNPEVEPTVGGFATASKTDATLAFVGADTGSDFYAPSGVEVCSEVGYAVGNGEGESASEIVTWDHATGAILSGPIEITVAQATVLNVIELDTLADCSVLTILILAGDPSTQVIAAVDPVTGVAEVLVEIPEETGEATGLATTTSGATFLFVSDGPSPAFAPVDLAGGTIGDWTEMVGFSEYFESSGFSAGVDFDAADGLWIVVGVNAEEEYHLISYAAGADLGSGTPTDIGILPYYPNPSELRIESPIPLAAEGHTPAPAPAPAPQLAATGADLPGPAIAGASVFLLGGLALLLTRRRKAA